MAKWIEWNGGKQPVPDDTYVEVRFRGDGSTDEDIAAVWEWSHNWSGCDIVAYRVLEDE